MMRKLEKGVIISKDTFYEGQRILLDFMQNFDEHDYILVGNTNSGFIAVASETHFSPNYLPRRFRFNIGALHQYILTSEKEVKYADELKSGDTVLIGKKDKYCELPIARVKKEIRPFVKITCECNGLNISYFYKRMLQLPSLLKMD